MASVWHASGMCTDVWRADGALTLGDESGVIGGTMVALTPARYLWCPSAENKMSTKIEVELQRLHGRAEFIGC